MIAEDELVADAILTPEKTIPVSEIFGPTLEGEGPWAGQPTYFLRIGGCDYGCLWCDTDQAVTAENVRKLPRLTQTEIWERLYEYSREHPGPDLLAISGGNPGLYDLGRIVDNWQSHDQTANGHEPYMKKVLVETQGSLFKSWMAEVNLLTISPKAPSSGLDPDKSLAAFDTFWQNYSLQKANNRLQNYRTPLDHKAILKVVVFDEVDYVFAQQLRRLYPLVPFHLSTGTAMGGLSGRWVPPDYSGGNPERDRFRVVRGHQNVFWTPNTYVDTKESLLDRYRWLAERAMNDPIMADAKVQVQLHCLLWGITTKGV